MRVDFSTIAKGINSGYPTANRIVISNTAAWIDIWQQHSCDHIPPPPVPEVDFTQYQVVAVFAGEKPTGGYSVEVTNVEIKNSHLVAIIKSCQPQADALVTEAFTQPHHIIKIPLLSVDKVVFEQA